MQFLKKHLLTMLALFAIADVIFTVATLYTSDSMHIRHLLSLFMDGLVIIVVAIVVAVEAMRVDLLAKFDPSR